VSAIYSENNRGLNNKVKRLIVSKSIKWNISATAHNAKRKNLQHDVSKKTELDSDFFDVFPERRFELATKLQTEKLAGDLQDAEYLFVAGFQFREKFLLQLKCDLLIGGQDRAYSFRNLEDAAQRLQRFVHWGVSFEETFHPSFAVLALNVHGLRHTSVFSRLV
jgi:hypothetical protein